MASLILDSPLNESQRQYTETIIQSGESLLVILNNILDFSKIEQDKLTLEETEFELVSLLDNSVTLMAPQAHAKGLEELLSKVDGAVKSRFLMRVGWVIIVHH